MSTTQGVSLCTLAPSPSLRVLLLITRGKSHGGSGTELSFWAGLSLMQALRGSDFSLFLPTPPPNVNKTPPCMRENMSGEGESFVPCSQWQEISEQGSLTFPSGKKSLLLLLQKQWLSAWA